MKKVSLVVVIAISIFLSSCSKEAPTNMEYDISIMSFNLRYDNTEDGENQWDNRKEACIQMLNEYTPGVFGIQEGLYNQVHYLNDELPDYEFVGVGRDDGYSGGEYNAIFYNTEKYEILEDSTFWLSETPSYPSYGWDAACKRIVTFGKFHDIDNDKYFYLFNTHLDHEGKEAREKSAKLLVEKVKEFNTEDYPVFITGDFNATSSNSIMKPIKKAFSNTRKEAEYSDNTKTFNGFGKWYLPHSNIDYIFFKHVSAMSYKTINKDYGVDYISDHYPIIGKYHYGELMIN
jgi:endonuclease/exonuclease/phosphatase family metal-dependent hydrolase